MNNRLALAQDLKSLMEQRVALLGRDENPINKLRGRARRTEADKFWSALNALEELWGEACTTEELIESPQGRIERDGKIYWLDERKLCAEAGINYIEHKLNKIKIIIEDETGVGGASYAASDYFSKWTNQDTLPEIFEFFATYPDEEVRARVARAEYTPTSILMDMANNPNETDTIRFAAQGNVVFGKAPHPLSESTGFPDSTAEQDKHMEHRKSFRIKTRNFKHLFNIATASNDSLERHDARKVLHDGFRHERHEDTGWYQLNPSRYSLVDGYVPPS
jgi:hypothetical protein